MGDFLTVNNNFRYESKCQKIMKHKMVEEKRPICKLEMMTSNQTPCKSKSLELNPSCKRVMKCKLGMKMMKKSYPATECEKVAIGEEEKCVEMVKLKKEKHEAKHCSFHPKTVCRQQEGKKCRRVRRKMCNYQDTNI